MKRIMTRTQQFGSIHYMKGDEVFARRIGKTGNYILSKRKHEPVGPTVTKSFLDELTEWVDDSAAANAECE